MKSRVIIVAVAVMATSGTSFADTPASAAKQSAVFVGTAVAGAIVAGPIGYLAGGLTGAWLATKVGEADQLDDRLADLDASEQHAESLTAQLDRAESRNVELEHDLSASLNASAHYRRVASEYVSFELLFHTGQSRLAGDSERRLRQLATFLAEQPEIDVTLSGYADPRGDDAFNLSLSESRVRAIADTLEANGVAPTRISMNAFGDRESSASDGDLDAYALERRVTIELAVPEFVTEVASIAD